MDTLERLAVNDHGFVFDPQTGTSYTVNGTGLITLRGLREGADEDTIVQRICDRYRASADAVRADVAAFQHDLARMGLL